jgi:phosphoribosyl-ATP pyrophosphohydrolase
MGFAIAFASRLALHFGLCKIAASSLENSLMEPQPDILDLVFATIQARKATPKAGSYTNQLLEAGLDEITKKVGEEAVEVIIAAHKQGRERVISEMADLAYHSLVLLAALDLSPDDVRTELSRRHR